MFDTVLVANRGEIAVRVIRTLRRLGDPRGRRLQRRRRRPRGTSARPTWRSASGPRPPRAATSTPARLVAAARAAGAQAVHPGYGFLAENADFAQACRATPGLVFDRPAAGGDRARWATRSARSRLVAAAGVPVVPGEHRPGMTDDDLVAAAAGIGFPVLLKPSAGGGGKGMRRVRRRLRGPRGGDRRRAARGGRGVRRRRAAARAVRRAPAAHRDPGPGRRARRRASTSASASAACSGGTRRSSRRRRRRC